LVIFIAASFYVMVPFLVQPVVVVFTCFLAMVITYIELRYLNLFQLIDISLDQSNNIL